MEPTDLMETQPSQAAVEVETALSETALKATALSVAPEMFH
jgi:hypothetical protein